MSPGEWIALSALVATVVSAIWRLGSKLGVIQTDVHAVKNTVQEIHKDQHETRKDVGVQGVAIAKHEVQINAHERRISVLEEAS